MPENAFFQQIAEKMVAIALDCRFYVKKDLDFSETLDRTPTYNYNIYNAFESIIIHDERDAVRRKCEINAWRPRS